MSPIDSDSNIVLLSLDGTTVMHESLEVLYGREKLGIHLPAGSRPQLIRKPAMPRVSEPEVAVRNALAGEHTNTKSLFELAREAQSACIVICDITRPVPNHLFLRPVIQTMLDAGMQSEAITVLVATGLHRPNEGQELLELVGDPWVLETVRVINHDARNDHDHVDLGNTKTRGTPVLIDKHLVNADLKIATGLVEPHFMAGYSGGRKVIAPGVAHARTIRTFHSYRFMTDPSAVNCNLISNPLHEEQLEIVKKLGGAHAINTVIDEDRNLAFFNFGEINSSHEQAVKFIEKYCRVAVSKLLDVVITCGGGYPLDKTYYQTVKGMVGAMDILAPGGDLIIASECSEGIGSSEYIQAQQRLTQLGAEGFLNSLSKKPLADIDEWQTQMQTKPMGVGQIHLYSKLDQDQNRLTGVNRIEDWNEFLSCLSPEKSVAIIPEGPYVIPYLATGE